MDVSVIIVNYNTAEQLYVLLENILKRTEISEN
jgi:GT2 family glycosyltransferase